MAKDASAGVTLTPPSRSGRGDLSLAFEIGGGAASENRIRTGAYPDLSVDWKGLTTGKSVEADETPKPIAPANHPAFPDAK